MNTPKTPQEKKRLSLERDRRNTYGENAKASRKGIPKSKQTSHQTERRAANAPLREIRGTFSEEAADQSALASRVGAIGRRRESFKKCPDQQLGLVLEEKKRSNRGSFKAFGDLEQKRRKGRF